jgi:hypothetical protein
MGLTAKQAWRSMLIISPTPCTYITRRDKPWDKTFRTPSPLRCLPKYVMPSVMLHRDNLQQFLLDILKDSDDPLVVKFALRLLKWLTSMELPLNRLTAMRSPSFGIVCNED